jgi:ureidoacrylate peracid hydrolase
MSAMGNQASIGIGRPSADLVPLADKVMPERTALLVVDVQHDFCATDGALARTGADVEPADSAARSIAESLLPAARASGVMPVFVRLIGDPTTQTPAWIDQRIRRAGAPYRAWAAPGSVGSQFYLVEPHPSDPIVDKVRYSSFEGTKLQHVLRSREIQTVVVCGVATNVCVDTAVREAFARDYFVVLVRDCTAGTSLASHEAALENLGRFFCQVVAASEIVALWQGRASRAADGPVVEA